MEQCCHIMVLSNPKSSGVYIYWQS